jgi:hypothetical protein
VADSVEKQAAVREAGQRIVKRALVELLVQTPVLDSHGGLEREGSGQCEPPLVDGPVLRRCELRDPDGIRMSDEREQKHHPAAQSAEPRPLHRIGRRIGAVDDHTHAFANDAAECRTVHEGLRFGLQ